MDAQKQFFVRRAKLHFRASKFSMIPRWHNMGILGKEEFWAGAQPNPSQHMHSGSSQTEIAGDNPCYRQLSGDITTSNQKEFDLADDRKSLKHARPRLSRRAKRLRQTEVLPAVEV